MYGEMILYPVHAECQSGDYEMVTNYIAAMLTPIIGHGQLWINPLLHQIAS